MTHAFPHTVIRASAGTGKTYQLSTRYLALLHAGVEPDRILATTFTRKAAGEILQRVLQRLAEAALAPERLQQLGEALNDSKLSHDRCLQLLAQLARNLHRVRIGTLDSFFAQIAGSLSLELGLPPGWRIVEEHIDAGVRRDAIEAVLGSDDVEEVSRLMHLMTQGAAERSVSQLMAATVDHLYAVFQQTDEAAWRNFPPVHPLSKEELAALLDSLQSADLPPDKRFVKARDEDIQSARDEDWGCLARKGLLCKVAQGTLEYFRKPIPPDVVALYERLLGHVRAQFLQQLRTQTAATYDLLALFDQAYQQRKHAGRALRFDDVTRQLAHFGPDRMLDRIDFRLDGDVAHLLLDEFQDTSFWQWAVLRPFAERVTGFSSPAREVQQAAGGRSFFCVGDVKQAIYGWRGGKAELFDAIERQLPGLTGHALAQSRRSAPAIMETVNRIFTGLPRHERLDAAAEGVRQWCEAFPLHTTVHTGEPGYAALETAPLSEADQPLSTLRFAARRVAELVARMPGREIGVLARRNATVARMIYELKQLGVHASEEGGNPLTDSAAVGAMLALLQLADHPGSSVARFHVAHSPLGTMLDYRQWNDDVHTEQLAANIRAQLVGDGYGPTLRDWTRRILGSTSRRDRSRLWQLVQLGYDYDAQATLRPSDFVRFVRGQRVADPTPADVRVMTIHQSKGLEFDNVVLIDLHVSFLGQSESYVVDQPDPVQPIERVALYRGEEFQRMLPDNLQRMYQQALHQKVADSLCVLYVALTRAIHGLHMIIPPSSASEKGVPKTYAGLLRAALADQDPAPPQRVLYACGDPDWSDSAAAPVLRSTAPTEPSGRITLLPTPGTLALKRTTPSRREGAGLRSVARQLRMDESFGRLHGTLLHAWCQQLKWLDEPLPTRDSLRRVAADITADEGLVERALDSWFAALEAPAVSAVLHSSFYRSGGAWPWAADPKVKNGKLELFTERRFAVRVQKENELISGAIDRLILVRDQGRVVAADIVDFKTDELPVNGDAALEAAADFYRPQLQAYQEAVSTMYDLPPSRVTARLVLLSPQIVYAL